MIVDIEKLSDEQISAIYRSTFPRGPYLITADVHKFARAIITEVERLRAELAAGAAKGGDTNQVGCERDDGLLNIHAKSERCEVCAAPAAGTVEKDAAQGNKGESL